MVPKPEDDLTETSALVARSKAGDEAAFAELMGRYKSRLAGFVHSRLPPSRRAVTDTQDAVQEITWKIWQSLGRFEDRGIGSFWLFLRQVAKNRLIDEWRKAGRKGEIKGAPGAAGGSSAAAVEAAFERIDPEQTPKSAAISAEEQEQFERALDHVPEQARRAIVLRLELGLEYDAIARDVEYPSPDAARVAIRRALMKVAAEIAELGREE